MVEFQEDDDVVLMETQNMAMDFMNDLDKEMLNATQNDSTTTVQVQVHNDPTEDNEDVCDEEAVFDTNIDMGDE